MARKITTDAINAFMSGREFSRDNTRVSVESEKHQLVHLYLHNNLIAKRYVENGEQMLMISNAGWSTNTTKERLNGIPGVRISQKSFSWYLNGKEWDGGWVKIG